MRLGGQAARSIGLSASFWVRISHPSTLRHRDLTGRKQRPKPSLHAEHHREHDRADLSVELGSHYGAVQDQTDDRFLGQRLGIPGIPIALYPLPQPSPYPCRLRRRRLRRALGAFDGKTATSRHQAWSLPRRQDPPRRGATTRPRDLIDSKKGRPRTPFSSIARNFSD
jgi:hypothetical protein